MSIRPIVTTLPLLMPLAAVAQETPPPVDLICEMAVICIEANPCQEWGQEIRVSELEDGNWRVLWEDDLPSDYALAADIPAPDGSLEPTRLRSLIFANAETQAVQLVSIEDGGNMVVSLHQPQARPRSVTGFGLCSDRDDTAAETSE